MLPIIIDFIKKYIGQTGLYAIVFVVFGFTVALSYDKYLAAPEQLQEVKASVQEQKIMLQIQIYEIQINNLTNELYQLKKLKAKKSADEDDLDRLTEVKKLIDSITIKKDSLQTILFEKRSK